MWTEHDSEDRYFSREGTVLIIKRSNFLYIIGGTNPEKWFLVCPRPFNALFFSDGGCFFHSFSVEPLYFMVWTCLCMMCTVSRVEVWNLGPIFFALRYHIYCHNSKLEFTTRVKKEKK